MSCLPTLFMKLLVRFFMRKSSIQRYYYSPSTTTNSYQSSSLSLSSLFYYFFNIFSITNFVTISLFLSHFGWLIEFSLRRRLKSLRNQAYNMTIKSRAKGDDFWMGYVEEWEVPPVEKSRRRISKRRWYRTLASPLIRIDLLKSTAKKF
ncbi:hypothetical protein BY996DRAFT_6550388 [Phakopsora pachyrhizi]|nr:hypothetical protein BY996DRAFT_6550388 [Phakopsora pachyrhizi]